MARAAPRSCAARGIRRPPAPQLSLLHSGPGDLAALPGAKQQGQGRSRIDGVGCGGWTLGPGSGQCECPFPAPRIPQGRNLRAAASTPANSAAQALNLPGPGCAFGAPSSFSLLPPTEPFILLLAAARHPGPGIREERQPPLAVPEGAPLPTRSSGGSGPARRGLQRRTVPEAPRALLLRGGLEVAVSAPLLPPSPRRPARVPHPRQPQVHPAGERGRPARRDGPGPGVPWERGRAGGRATRSARVSGSWVSRGKARRDAARNWRFWK